MPRRPRRVAGERGRREPLTAVYKGCPHRSVTCSNSLQGLSEQHQLGALTVHMSCPHSCE